LLEFEAALDFSLHFFWHICNDLALVSEFFIEISKQLTGRSKALIFPSRSPTAPLLAKWTAETCVGRSKLHPSLLLSLEVWAFQFPLL
jgi:hypothetical protein